MHQRAVILGLAALFSLAALAGCMGGRKPADPAGDLLNRAIDAAGGRKALERATAFSWTGQAKVHAGGKVAEIGLSTRVTPFQAARTESWLLADGPAKARTLILEGGEGWIEQGGKREPMDPAMLANESQQFALYGLMRLVSLREEGARAQIGLKTEDGLSCLAAIHPKAPVTQLCFDAKGRLKRAFNLVASPDGKSKLDQRFDFEGEIESAGVRWPRKITIRQGGSPFFELSLESFTVERG